MRKHRQINLAPGYQGKETGSLNRKLLEGLFMMDSPEMICMLGRKSQ